MRALAAAGFAALVVAGAAAGHITLAPPFVEANTPTTISFETPNERRGHATTSLAIVAPTGVQLTAAEAPPGWRLELAGGTARWAGGRIEGEQTVAFPLVVTARTRAGLETFRATQGYDDGGVVRWSARLTVLPASAADAPPQHLRRALIASAVGLVVIAGSFATLRRLRRQPGGDD
jgi:uncharacterized protein YcnI